MLRFHFIKTREFGGSGQRVDETAMPRMHISTEVLA